VVGLAALYAIGSLLTAVRRSDGVRGTVAPSH